jgi:transcriptional regulator with XRE-family HTH domain
MTAQMKVLRTVEALVEIPDLGERIKVARETHMKENGKSVTQVCAELGWSASYQYKLEAERNVVSVPYETLLTLESVFGVDLGSNLTKAALLEAVNRVVS